MIKLLIAFFLSLFRKPRVSIPEAIDYVPLPPVVVVEAVVVPPVAFKYLWDTPTNTRHSVRLICDEEGLTTLEKNELCATVGGESGWKPQAIGKPNSNGTRDYGIVQVNSKWWIGEGKKFSSIEYVLNNPEICVRWMCEEWKKGMQKPQSFYSVH